MTASYGAAGRAGAQRRRPAARPDPRRRRRRLAGRAPSCCCSARCGWPGSRCRAWPSRGFGRLVFVTSTAVRQPQPDLAISVVLRAAVTAAAKLLSLEYAGRGVTVNCVAPGATDTERRRDDPGQPGRADRPAGRRTGRARTREQVPAGRPGTPDEIAAAVAFLASADAGYVNGTVLTVDGGRTETF